MSDELVTVEELREFAAEMTRASELYRTNSKFAPDEARRAPRPATVLIVDLSIWVGVALNIDVMSSGPSAVPFLAPRCATEAGPRVVVGDR